MDFHFASLARRWTQTPSNRLADALAQARRDHLDFIDLVNANPHENGLVFPEDALKEIAAQALEAPNVRVYKPDPRGQLPAREAIAQFYRRREHPAHPDRIVLTPGTSLAYFYAIRLLAEPGDDILIPSPGYPLFDEIAAVCGISLRSYHLTARSGAWRPDLDDLAFQCTPRTRAIMAVSPHNPAGTVFTAAELESLGQLCRERRLAVVFDEVFSEFLDPPISSLPRPRPGDFPLTFVLNGFSKMFSLPGWKVGWMAIDGDPEAVDPLLHALEFLSDTFLPVPEFVQAMIPGVLRTGDPAVSAALAREYDARRHLALRSLRCPVYAPDGGVYLCGRLPEGRDEEEFCCRALRQEGVFVHPGYYYSLPPGHVVFTCISSPDRLREGIERLNHSLG